MSLNKVMLIGNVGQEPKVRYLDTGVCVASISLATSEPGYTLPNGTKVPERPEWHSILCWNKMAEYVENNVHKGDKLYVEGKIQTRSYNDKMGINRKVVEIMATNLELLSSRSSHNQYSSANVEPSASTNQPNSSSDKSDIEKLPF